MPKAENYLNLDIFATNIPAFDYEDKVETVYKFFKEKPFYMYVVILKDSVPIGIVHKKDLALANKNLSVGEFSKPIPKVKNTYVNPENLSDVIEILRLQVSDILLVNNKNHYIGILNCETILHYLSKLPDTPQHKISNMLGKDYTAVLLGFQDFKSLKEELGYKIDYTFKLIKDLLRSLSQECCVYIEKMDNDILSVHRNKITKEIISKFFEEFYKEYTVLLQEHEPPVLFAIVFDLNNIKTYEILMNRIDLLRVYIKNMKHTVTIFDGPQPLLSTYISKKDSEDVKLIKEKIISSIKDVVKNLIKTEKNLWEFVLYDMFKAYPFYDLFYTINEAGMQISNNIVNPAAKKPIATGRKGADRSGEIYFKNASEEPFITEVYLSKATDDFCISVSKAFQFQNKRYIVVGDIAYSEISKISIQTN